MKIKIRTIPAGYYFVTEMARAKSRHHGIVMHKARQNILDMVLCTWEHGNVAMLLTFFSCLSQAVCVRVSISWSEMQSKRTNVFSKQIRRVSADEIRTHTYTLFELFG